MKDEVDAAVKFITKLIKQNSSLREQDLMRFQQSLYLFLIQKFNNHWHPEKPWQGQGYRCLRLNGLNGKEPTIAKAASECGLQYSDLKLPLELTVWVDPDEVCCRFGEHKGSYCTVASFKEGKNETFIDQIDLTKISSAEGVDCKVKGHSKNKGSPKSTSSDSINLKAASVSGKACSSKKENISPSKSPTNIGKMGVSSLQYNESSSKRCHYNSMQSGVNERVFNGNSPYIYNDHTKSAFQRDSRAVPPYNHAVEFSPYYKPQPWLGCPTSVSPPHSPYLSGAYYDFSPPPFSSQENLTLSRLSPVNLNRLRWNSGSYNENPLPRNGWYLSRNLARV